MALKVIGTGQGRTGTMSLKNALEQLGFGKCYHMYELIANTPEHIAYFQRAERGEQVDWDKMLQGFGSAVDFPIIQYYPQLIKKYPDAKIIHTMRDPESWFKSASDTILNVGRPGPLKMVKTLVQLPFSPKLRNRMKVFGYIGRMKKKEFGADVKDKATVIKRFNEWNERALKDLPKDRLLIYNVKDGWEPLCKFLNVPVPNTPFPKTNSTEEFIQQTKNM
ncbi:MAG: sulfotransferase family protein [Bacteroidota bacterium]|nr:sulfotransferase family protein [Bacteroidota bacterium]